MAQTDASEKDALAAKIEGGAVLEQEQHDFVGLTDVTEEEKLLRRKLQLRIFPWVFIMYFFSYMDRSNISAAIVMNSETGHALSQTTLTTQQVSVGLGLFYVGYVLFEIPSNIMMTRVPASAWFARIMISWGITLGLFAVMSEAWHFYLLRFLLGAFEAGFFPGVAYYMTFWFRKRETSSGFSYWFLGLPLSNAISSALSLGISYMDGVAGLYGWKWNFIIYAVLTVIVGVITIFYLPDSPKRASYKNNFLTDEQVKLAASRMDAEQEGTGAGHGHSIKDLLLSLKDWKAVAFGFTYLPGLCASTSLAYYVPTFVKSLGSFTSTQAMGLAVPVWLYAAVHMVVMAHLSDRFGNRSVILLANITLAGICFVLMGVLADFSSPWAAYAFTFLALGGTKTVTTVCIPWATNSFDGTTAAARIAFVTTIGNAGNIVTSFLLFNGWKEDVGRKFIGSLCISGGLMIISIISIFILRAHMKKVNKEIDETGVHAATGRTKHFIL
ncbi:major facilitator superfamily domain-containing protein [Cladochytrium replicatum]|nr:major facilitator superfamily domain-containing protein [Cladochytrium replicatum]